MTEQIPAEAVEAAAGAVGVHRVTLVRGSLWHCRTCGQEWEVSESADEPFLEVDAHVARAALSAGAAAVRTRHSEAEDDHG